MRLGHVLAMAPMIGAIGEQAARHALRVGDRLPHPSEAEFRLACDVARAIPLRRQRDPRWRAHVMHRGVRALAVSVADPTRAAPNPTRPDARGVYAPLPREPVLSEALPHANASEYSPCGTSAWSRGHAHAPHLMPQHARRVSDAFDAERFRREILAHRERHAPGSLQEQRARVGLGLPDPETDERIKRVRLEEAELRARLVVLAHKNRKVLKILDREAGDRKVRVVRGKSDRIIWRDVREMGD